jgi:hypothetical protein
METGTGDNPDLPIMSVFISYSHADSGLVDSLAAVLEELDVEYFRDVKDIRLGEPITAKVIEALTRCRTLLVVVSPTSLESHWVPYEIGGASALRKVIVPFLTDRLIDVPTYIRDLNYATTLEQIRRHFKGDPGVASITRDDASPQPEPDPASSERRDVLKPEETAGKVLETIFETIRQYDQSHTFESLYKGRWVKWTGNLDKNPSRDGDTWRCYISEAKTRALIVARTHQNISEFRVPARVEVEGKIDGYGGINSRMLNALRDAEHFDPIQRIHLVNAVIRAAT